VKGADGRESRRVRVKLVNSVIPRLNVTLPLYLGGRVYKWAPLSRQGAALAQSGSQPRTPFSHVTYNLDPFWARDTGNGAKFGSLWLLCQRDWSHPLKAAGTSAFAKGDEITAQTAKFARGYISLLFVFEEVGLRWVRGSKRTTLWVSKVYPTTILRFELLQLRLHQFEIMRLEMVASKVGYLNILQDRVYALLYFKPKQPELH
jgi:hypothetical protein